MANEKPLGVFIAIITILFYTMTLYAPLQNMSYYVMQSAMFGMDLKMITFKSFLMITVAFKCSLFALCMMTFGTFHYVLTDPPCSGMFSRKTNVQQGYDNENSIELKENSMIEGVYDNPNNTSAYPLSRSGNPSYAHGY